MTLPFDAVVLDLDGVVTLTARVHAAAWKRLFDAFLDEHARRTGERVRPFDADGDYRALVDGRPRAEGVRAFLASRGIALPPGDPSDPPERLTVWGLGNRKDALFRASLAATGVDVDAGAVALVRELRTRGVRVGVATSSRNGELVLERAGLRDLFDARVDGVVSERLQLRGKPAPDVFVKCLELLRRPDPARAIVVEDAVPGVAAGRAGGFGLVVGIDRGGSAGALRASGADRVVSDPGELSVALLERWFLDLRRSPSRTTAPSRPRRWPRRRGA